MNEEQEHQDLTEVLQNINLVDCLDKDNVTKLQELCNKNKQLSKPSYEKFNTIGAPNSQQFIVECVVNLLSNSGDLLRNFSAEGTGDTKQNAKKAAAGIVFDDIKRYKQACFREHQNLHTLQTAYEPSTVILGQGGFGLVLKMKRIWDGLECAIKLIQFNDNDLEFTKREVQVLASLSHRNVLIYHNSWVAGEIKSIVPAGTKFCSFGSYNRTLLVETEICRQNLENWVYEVNKTVALSNSAILQRFRFTKHITLALEYIHSKKIMHRDLKPANVLIDIHENAKIADFGLAKFTESGLTCHNTPSVGDLWFQAPEANSSTYNESCDLYSLGLVCYFIFDTNSTTGFETCEKIVKPLKNKANSFGDVLHNQFSEQESCFKKLSSIQPEERLSLRLFLIKIRAWLRDIKEQNAEAYKVTNADTKPDGSK